MVLSLLTLFFQSDVTFSWIYLFQVKENTKVTLNPIVWTMFISLILDLMGFTVILPLMPKILDHYHSQGSTSIGAIQSTIQNLQERFNIPDKFTSVLTGGNLTHHC